MFTHLLDTITTAEAVDMRDIVMHTDKAHCLCIAKSYISKREHVSPSGAQKQSWTTRIVLLNQLFGNIGRHNITRTFFVKHISKFGIPNRKFIVFVYESGSRDVQSAHGRTYDKKRSLLPMIVIPVDCLHAGPAFWETTLAFSWPEPYFVDGRFQRYVLLYLVNTCGSKGMCSSIWSTRAVGSALVLHVTGNNNTGI